MTKKQKIIVLAVVVLVVLAGLVFKNNPQLLVGKPHRAVEKITYLTLGDTLQLQLKFYAPKTTPPQGGYPLAVFYHGGGWESGNMGQFYRHAERYTSVGLAVALVQYRTLDSNGSTPFDALMDARSAMRFLKANTSDLPINTSKTVAVGSSAGGHLAIGTAMLDTYNHAFDDLSVDPTPSLIIGINAIVDCGPDGFGPGYVTQEYKRFSPLHNVSGGLPPILLLYGQNDKYIPQQTQQEFAALWRSHGNQVSLIVYPGQGHGFAEYRNKIYFEKTIEASFAFLEEQGFDLEQY